LHKPLHFEKIQISNVTFVNTTIHANKDFSKALILFSDPERNLFPSTAPGMLPQADNRSDARISKRIIQTRFTWLFILNLSIITHTFKSMPVC
jgi:hypothetical protein